MAFMAFALMTSIACNKEDDEAGQPGEITITTSVSDNVVTYTASATDAVKFVWDLGNGETPTGTTVTGTYSFPGDYDVKCTAKGREQDRVKSIIFNVATGDPDVFNDVNTLLCGYNDATGESTTSWQWIDAENMMSNGPRDYSGDTVYFNAIDDSWWHNTTGEPQPDGGLDDDYSFKLNKTMDYVNNFNTEFVVSWGWAAVRGYGSPGIWEDMAFAGYNSGSSPMTSSWTVRHIADLNDTLKFETYVNGTMKPGAYVIELSNNSSLGMESAGYNYQILRLTPDSLWVRMDNTSPDNLASGGFYTQADLDGEGIVPGDPEYLYLRLARKQ